MHSVSGIELYHFERAGLIVRRAILSHWSERGCARGNPPSIREWAALWHSSRLGLVAEDLLGGVCHIQLFPAGSPPPYGARWHRISGPAWDAPASSQAAELARPSRELYFLVALRPCAALEVLPGTHVQAPAEEQMAAMCASPTAAVMGAVRLRLAAGDAAIVNPALIGRRSQGEDCECLQVVATSRV